MDIKALNTPTSKKTPGAIGFKHAQLREAAAENAPPPEGLLHQVCGNGVDQLLIKAMRYQSLDNLSIVMIGLKNFKQSLT